MTVFMYWNIRKKPLYDELGTACREHNVDILILAESGHDASSETRATRASRPTVTDKVSGQGAFILYILMEAARPSPMFSR